ncbi:hypothetical protein Fmac_005883 [Flemingia macrophylla]|uniref:Uncharacterized protein n=1 Tax=Flemingia macrophylla TaxID=520843 RepID=A0ABD1NAH1_9FABA
MATETRTRLNLWGILSESKRIINAHSRHFLGLSVMFLLPLSFTTVVSPFLLSPHRHSSNIRILLRHQQEEENALPILILILILLSLCATASITHSVFHGFFGRPVKLPTALLSILPSLLPLLATALLLHLPLLLLPFLPLPLPFPLLLLLLLPCLLYLRLTCILAPVLVVAESAWGLTPFRRSSSLVSGMLPVAASSFLFFSSLHALLLLSSTYLLRPSHSSSFALQIVLASTLLTLLLLYNAAADTVLYLYCKAVHGELAHDIAREFSWHYVSLPFDDAKLPHLVSVLTP